ncbi:MAG: AlpA family transcriptional regulator [Thiotrichales bacterium]|nr:AlpA family transcriptional regulator [Thiotrichales bacterium]MCY4350130.1 AlpA family transcriptional regulator [Thiotrichales bacterium]
MNNRLLRRPEVEAMTGLSRARIYALIATDGFPVPVRLGSNSVAWRLRDIEEWIDSLPAARSGERTSRGGSCASAG